MFGLAERDNLHGNLTDSVKVVIGPYEVLPIRIPLLTSFLSNGVEGSILISFFNVDLIGKVLNGLSIAVIDVDDDAESRMALSHCHKDCDYLINHLLSLMDLISKLSENVDILHRWLLKNSLLQ